jgi:hypothetical protein
MKRKHHVGKGFLVGYELLAPLEGEDFGFEAHVKV